MEIKNTNEIMGSIMTTQSITFTKVIKKDGSEIFINHSAISAIVDKIEYISILIGGEWIDIDITFNDLNVKINNYMANQ